MTRERDAEQRPKLRALGKAVREAREERGWSRAELVRRSGLSEMTIKRLEAGRGNPCLDSLYVLVCALHPRSHLGPLITRAEEIEQEEGQ